MGVENFTGFRWRDPSLGAYQQLLVHFTFRGRDLLAEGRLGDMQDFSGLVRLPISTIFTKYFSRLKFILPPVRNASVNAGSMMHWLLQFACQLCISSAVARRRQRYKG